jgi:esterase/lipase
MYLALITIFLVAIVLVFFWWYINRCLFLPGNIIKSTEDIPKKCGYITKNGILCSEKPKSKLCMYFEEFCSFPGERCVLFFHGTTGNITQRGYIISMCSALRVNLVLAEYPGYYKSSGIACPETFLFSSLKFYDAVVQKYSPKDIIIWGESLGGCAAIYVAAQRECSSLILCGTFASLADVLVPSIADTWFSNFIFSAFLINFPSKDWISSVSCPTTIIHSREDDVIPFSNAEILYSACSAKSKILVPIDGKHAAPRIKKSSLRKILTYNSFATDNLERVSSILNSIDFTDGMNV